MQRFTVFLIALIITLAMSADVKARTTRDMARACFEKAQTAFSKTTHATSDQAFARFMRQYLNIEALAEAAVRDQKLGYWSRMPEGHKRIVREAAKRITITIEKIDDFDLSSITPWFHRGRVGDSYFHLPGSMNKKDGTRVHFLIYIKVENGVCKFANANLEGVWLSKKLDLSRLRDRLEKR